jgi:hypothetical protein
MDPLVNRAIQLLEKGDQSLRQICYKLTENSNLSWETLRTRVKRAMKQKEKKHGNRLLSDLDELVLVGILLAFDSASMPLSRGALLEIVRSCFIHDDQWDGSSWFRRFISQHSEYISHIATKGLDLARVSIPSVDNIDGFIRCFENLMEQYPFVPELVINGDESPVDAMKAKPSKALVNANVKKHCTIDSPRDSIRTILPFVSAAGSVWMVVYIFKAKSSKNNSTIQPIYLSSTSTKKRGTWPTYYATTDKGFITEELWKDIMKVLLSLLKPYQHGRPVLLILDRHTTHLSVQTIKDALEQQVHSLFIPAHTTHFLQPLDDAVTGAFKNSIKRYKQKQIFSHVLHREAPVAVLQNITEEAANEALKPATIRAAFRNTGLWPFNPSLIRQRTNQALAQPENPRSDSLDDKIVAHASNVVNRLLKLHIPIKQQQVSGMAEKNKLYSGEELLEYYRKREEEAERQRQDEEKKRNERQERKRKKEEDNNRQQKSRKRSKLENEEEKKLTATLKESMTCKLCTRRYRGGQDWWTCDICQSYRLCHEHCFDVDAIEQHRQVCK